jgi:5-methylcytosine-specific restriction enzyme subunit McrC
VRHITAALRAAVGPRPRLPSPAELARVRYTPITLRFRSLALLSHRIASRLGYGVTGESGAAEGLLIDVAELWELFLLGCLRTTIPTGMSVEHGTTAGERLHLLESADGMRRMGRLKPDLIVRHGSDVVAIIDAKYKRLTASRDRPTGVDTADLYQLAAYASRLRPALAALVYPASPDDAQWPVASAESNGPWSLDGCAMQFSRAATDRAGCGMELNALLSDAAFLRSLARGRQRRATE